MLLSAVGIAPRLPVHEISCSGQPVSTRFNCRCRSSGGDLLYIPSRDYWGALVTALKSNSFYLNRKYFIGMLGRAWFWVTNQHQSSEYIYTEYVRLVPVNRNMDGPNSRIIRSNNRNRTPVSRVFVCPLKNFTWYFLFGNWDPLQACWGGPKLNRTTQCEDKGFNEPWVGLTETSGGFEFRFFARNLNL